MGGRQTFVIMCILLLAAGLRLGALGQDQRLHPDEALFATFARSAAVQGDWLLHGNLDKPPLSLYSTALGMTLFGVTSLPNGVLTLDVRQGEFAGRVVGVFTSLLLVAATGRLAARLYGAESRTVPLTMLLAGLSPLGLAFSATLFTDNLMLVCVTLGLAAAARGRWMQAGWWLGAGLWSKPQALYALPLVVAIGWIMQPTGRVRGALRLGIVLALSAALLLIWDGMRGQATGLLALAGANNDPGRLAGSDEVSPRLAQWISYGQYLLGNWWLTGALLAVGTGVLFSRKDRTDYALLVFVSLYSALHVAVAFSLHDRYVLLMLIPLCLLAGRGLERIHTWRPRMAGWLTAACALAMLPTSAMAIRGELPVGGDRGQHAGIDVVAAHLDSKPLGAIVYDHWLGWELGYYLGTWSDKRRVYYPTPNALAEDALLNPDRAPRYLVAPAGAAAGTWVGALEDAGFQVEKDYDDGRFRVWVLIPPAWVGSA